MRREDLESDYRGEQRKRYFEEHSYRKWSDIFRARIGINYGDYRERAFIRCYLDCDYSDDHESLALIHKVMSNGKSHPIDWVSFYAYFDERFNDPDNPYIHEMTEKMFPFMKDSPTVIELLNQYRENLLSQNYDIV